MDPKKVHRHLRRLEGRGFASRSAWIERILREHYSRDYGFLLSPDYTIGGSTKRTANAPITHLKRRLPQPPLRKTSVKRTPLEKSREEAGRLSGKELQILNPSNFNSTLVLLKLGARDRRELESIPKASVKLSPVFSWFHNKSIKFTNANRSMRKVYKNL